MKEFNEYSVAELIDLIYELHLEKKMSIRTIAKELKTYPQKLCRFAKKHKIPIMNASESLKCGYENGTIINPRKGVTLSEIEKLNIGDGQHRAWENLTEEERDERIKKSVEIFANRPDKETFSKMGSSAIRRASLEGSKLEKHLITVFKKNNIRHIHHYKGMFGDSNLEADFFLPDHNIILEVDGPSHFCSVFGVARYAEQQVFDQKKNAIVLNMGASIIRICHRRELFKRDYFYITTELLSILDNVNNELRVIDVS